MLYIHVPFCKSRCIYCDFYSTTATEDFRKAYVRAAQAEMTMRSGELQGAPLQSIYFGGGTPSQLQPDDIAGLLDTAAAYGWQKDVEITLEATAVPSGIRARSWIFTGPGEKQSVSA